MQRRPCHPSGTWVIVFVVIIAAHSIIGGLMLWGYGPEASASAARMRAPVSDTTLEKMSVSVVYYVCACMWVCARARSLGAHPSLMDLIWRKAAWMSEDMISCLILPSWMFHGVVPHAICPGSFVLSCRYPLMEYQRKRRSRSDMCSSSWVVLRPFVCSFGLHHSWCLY